jgi:hypothetical protein
MNDDEVIMMPAFTVTANRPGLLETFWHYGKKPLLITAGVLLVLHLFRARRK